MFNKFKYKFGFYFILILFLSCISSVSFSSDIYNENTLLGKDAIENSSLPSNYKIEANDIYYSGKDSFNVDYIVMGNIYSKTKSFSTTPLMNENSQIGGIVEGNLYLISEEINITSDYQKNEDDTITVSSASIIYGNVFAISDNFILDPGCEIKGDLYVKSTNVQLSQNATVSGNVYICSNTVDVSCQIGKDLYVQALDFSMGYYGFIYRDLHLFASNSSVSGVIYRDSYIDSDTLTTTKTFLNYGNILIDSKKIVFSGEIQGNATFNSKNIEFKDIEENSDITCVISGNLNYSPNGSIDVKKDIVLGEVKFQQYENKIDYPVVLKILSYFSKLLWIFAISLLINFISIIFFIILIVKLILKKKKVS